MKKQFISSLHDGDKLSSEQFVVKSIRQEKTKAGRDYVDLVLGDKTGEISGKIWEDSLGGYESVKSGDVVMVSGTVGSYRDKLQLTVTFLQKATKFDLSDFLKHTQRNIDELWATLEDAAEEIENKDLARLLKFFIKDEAFATEFKACPAGVTMHHDYIGGLLEHTVEMLNFSKAVLAEYSDIDASLLTSGIILHDIGKLEEYTVDNAIRRTTLGNLIGHTVLGALRVSNAMAEIKNFPKETNRKLLHMMISHHGHLEFGSPVRPMTREAVALYFLDNSSAKLNTVTKDIREALAIDPEQEFSEYNRGLETRLYLR
ncbi:MAG: HD domain-containing protein [Parcubacteria group bacterium]